MRHRTAISPPPGLAVAMGTLEVRQGAARTTGAGTINGEGLYTFRVKAKDDGEPSMDIDHFDIKIWNGTDTEADPIHEAKNTIGALVFLRTVGYH